MADQSGVDRKAALAKLKEEAENEMRRVLPEERASKRAKVDGDTSEDIQETDGDEEATPQEQQLVASRFNYAAVQELSTGLQGFLATCRIKREQSAIKELARVLNQVIYTEKPTAQPSAASAPSDGPKFSSVKLSACGLVALKWNEAGSAGTVNAASDTPEDFTINMAQRASEAVAKILDNIDAGKQEKLVFVQRIMPLQTTCRFEREALKEAGARLAPVAVPLLKGLENPSFAVAYKSRVGSGVKADAGGAAKPAAPDSHNATANATDEETIPGNNSPSPAAAGAAAADSVPSSTTPEQERMIAITSVAAGFESALKTNHGVSIKVDLKRPSVAIVIEMLPAQTGMHAGLAVVPQSMCVLKPKIVLKGVGRPMYVRGEAYIGPNH